MVHSFPSSIDYSVYDWTVQIQSHICIFSKKSLAIACEKSGFELIKKEVPCNGMKPIYYFKKVKEME